MKKSERYQVAIIAVMNAANIEDNDKVEILETLIDAKGTAVFVEEREIEK